MVVVKDKAEDAVKVRDKVKAVKVVAEVWAAEEIAKLDI
jgi:hypothetical protein